MTAEEFRVLTGHEPQNDDLDRVNCPRAGELLHAYCGTCIHGYPKFLVCERCHPWTALYR